MPRRRCCGTVERPPCCRRFSPEGGSAASITVSLEELEAIRLKDLVGLDQTECAAAMGLTRPTFQRLLNGARKKVSEALVEGYGLVFEGGHHRLRGLAVSGANGGQQDLIQNKAETGDARICPRCGKRAGKALCGCKQAEKQSR